MIQVAACFIPAIFIAGQNGHPEYVSLILALYGAAYRISIALEQK